MGEPLAILRPQGRLVLPQDLQADPGGDLVLIRCPALSWTAWSGLTHRRRRARVVRHTARRLGWLESLRDAGAILPVTLGTELEASDLARGQDVLRDWLDRLEGRVQFQVTVTWDHRRALRAFADAPEMAEGATGLPRLALRLVAQMEAILDPVVLDRVTLPVDGEAMVLNRAVLIRAQDEVLLDQAAEQIDSLWPEGLTLRLVGPTPALSFASARVERIPLQAVQAAAAVLDLAPPVSGAQLSQGAQDLATARRRALMQGREGIPAAAALIQDVAEAFSGGDPLPDPLALIRVFRDGVTAPVAPSSLPGPDPRSDHPGLAQSA